MTKIKLLLSASALALSAAALATPAAATCFGCSFNSDSSTFDYGAGGEASNSGKSYGDLAGGNSDTTKHVYGGGDSTSNSGSDSTADSYSGAHFDTDGKSYGGSFSLGGTAKAGSEEHGNVLGNGFAVTSETGTKKTFLGDFTVTRTKESNYAFGAGGDAVNKGKASGDLSWAGSVTTKKVYGGGDAASNTNGPNTATSYSGSHMNTAGYSGAKSFGNGNQSTGSYEFGEVGGGGATSATTTTEYSFGS